MNIRQLEQFVRIVEQGSIGKAARLLNISQPALTKSLRQLESHLKVRLLNRSAYGVQLTAYGESLYEHAKRVSFELTRAERDIDALRGVRKGKVSVGTIPIAAYRLLPAAITRLSSVRPGITVAVTEKNNSELLPAFNQGQFDFIIGILDEHEIEAQFSSKVLFYDEMVAITRPDHPLAKLSDVSVKELASHPWIYPKPGSAHRRRLDDFFKNAGIEPPTCAVEGGSEALIAGLLMQSDFVAAMSAGVQRFDHNTKSLAVVKSSVKIPPRPIGILHRGWDQLSPMAKALMSEIDRARIAQG